MRESQFWVSDQRSSKAIHPLTEQLYLLKNVFVSPFSFEQTFPCKINLLACKYLDMEVKNVKMGALKEKVLFDELAFFTN